MYSYKNWQYLSKHSLPPLPSNISQQLFNKHLQSVRYVFLARAEAKKVNCIFSFNRFHFPPCKYDFDYYVSRLWPGSVSSSPEENTTELLPTTTSLAWACETLFWGFICLLNFKFLFTSELFYVMLPKIIKLLKSWVLRLALCALRLAPNFMKSDPVEMLCPYTCKLGSATP